jgi:hypothetical protein
VVAITAVLVSRCSGHLQVEALKFSIEVLRRDKEELHEQLSAAAGDLRDDDSAEGDEGAFYAVGERRVYR